jgi:hypothetical protein
MNCSLSLSKQLHSVYFCNIFKTSFHKSSLKVIGEFKAYKEIRDKLGAVEK